MKFDNHDLVHVANTVRPHGLNGHISIKLNQEYSEETLFTERPVFLYIEGLPVPFFPEEIKTAGEYFAVKFKWIENSEEADKYKNLQVYIPENDCILNDNQNLDFNLIGYAVHDIKYGFVGNITNFNDIPGNPVFETQLDNKTIIIPYVDDFIISINENTKTVEIQTPVGLIDIYLT